MTSVTSYSQHVLDKFALVDFKTMEDDLALAQLNDALMSSPWLARYHRKADIDYVYGSTPGAQLEVTHDISPQLRQTLYLNVSVVDDAPVLTGCVDLYERKRISTLRPELELLSSNDLSFAFDLGKGDEAADREFFIPLFKCALGDILQHLSGVVGLPREGLLPIAPAIACKFLSNERASMCMA